MMKKRRLQATRTSEVSFRTAGGCIETDNGRSVQEGLELRADGAAILIQQADRQARVGWLAGAAEGQPEEQGEGDRHDQEEQEGHAVAQDLHKVFLGDVEDAVHVFSPPSPI